MTYAIILAGGSGARFWPLSRKATPKQFLSFSSNESLLEETVKRLNGFVIKDNIYIATSKIYKKNIFDIFHKFGIKSENIFFEPQGRNTFAPIGVLSKLIYDKDNDAAIVVLPSDHHIADGAEFARKLKIAFRATEKGYIVTIGLKPGHPETGYGYIKIRPPLARHSSSVYKVDRFIEKPKLEKAKQFLKDKRYYWNSGIFIFKASVMLKEIKELAHKDYDLILKIKNSEDKFRFWKKFTPLSIDYVIMEKSNKIALVPADFGWIDLGSWKAVEYFFQKDAQGNISRGNCIDIGSKNSIFWSDSRRLVTVGLDNAIIVDIKDALLVCAKDRAQDVGKIVKILEGRIAK